MCKSKMSERFALTHHNTRFKVASMGSHWPESLLLVLNIKHRSHHYQSSIYSIIVGQLVERWIESVPHLFLSSTEVAWLGRGTFWSTCKKDNLQDPHISTQFNFACPRLCQTVLHNYNNDQQNRCVQSQVRFWILRINPNNHLFAILNSMLQSNYHQVLAHGSFD
jgi:hypothetical protein